MLATAALALAALAPWIYRRLRAGALTARALAWPTMASRWLSGHVRATSYAGEAFFRADGADAALVRRRTAALDRLAACFAAGREQALRLGQEMREGLSDLRFADANRVPFPFVRVMRERFDPTAVVTESRGPYLRGVDGEWSLDVGGSYGLNVAGFDRYKSWIEAGWQRVKALGPVLGPVHPLVAGNVAALKRVSGLDDVSFHMSGTEAVMAAVRLARFNTRRTLVVCFAGAYHGWWDGVVAGLGSERRLDDCLTLRDLDPASLKVIEARAHEIAAVLVNPVQSFHPNAPPPNDAVLLTSAARRAGAAQEAYAEWLAHLRLVCSSVDVPLVFDEVYTGFRLAPGGAQDYFEVQADMVVYGKTVAGGMPIGVVCGRRDLMRRFDPERPMRIAYVVGTFSAHPVVMGAMHEFLDWATAPDAEARYAEMNRRCAAWVADTNRQLAAADLPLRVAALGTIWTVLFTQAGRYNWLLQYYLRAEGVSLAWVGTGRCLCSMDFTADDYATLQGALLRAASQMRDDGWWLDLRNHPGREKQMRRMLVKEMAGSLVPEPVRAFYREIMVRKQDDHHASHNDVGNQLLHFVSSSAFLYCYAILAFDLTTAMCLGLAALLLRQFGHVALEADSHERETTLLGYTTRNKTAIVLGYAGIPVAHLTAAPDWGWQAAIGRLPAIAEHWWYWTLFVIAARVVYLIWKFSFRTSMIWYVKLVTDPLTDVVTYFPGRLRA